MTTEPQTHLFPCDACGSDLRYAPGTDALECDHCGNTQPIEGAQSTWRGGAIQELDFHQAIKNGLSEYEHSELRTISCENCGAHVEFDPKTHAAECPFCATPIVADTGPERQIKPRGLLPFAMKEDTARDQMTKWLGRLWFAPTGLQEYARKGRKLQGVYIPYWTYDADTSSQYTGQRGTIYYTTRQVSVMVDGKRQTRTQRVQKIRWNNVRGGVARFFDDVLVLGSKSLPPKVTDGLAPWDLSEMEPYREEYLAGFRAEGYTISLEDGYDQASAYMDRMIARDVKHDIGGDRQKITNVDTKIGTLTFKHILLPVWLAAYKYRGKTYRFVVNGRTGAVQGERPYSAVKIAIAVVFGLLVAGAVGYFIATGEQTGQFTQGY